MTTIGIDEIALTKGRDNFVAIADVPKVRAYCERFIGSLKRECLDHMLILHRGQLHRLVTEFIDYYNYSRPRQGIG